MISLVAGRRRLINVATVLAALAVLAMATPAAADNPTPQGNKLWSNGATSTYKWDASVPAWLRPVMTNVLETTWADPATNNSNGPRFSYSTTGSGTIQYLASNSVCGSGGWLGCADARYVPAWKIWLTSNPQSVGYGKNWCDLSLVSGCPDAGRVAIHEVGHVGGFLDHNPTTVWAETRMRSPSFPFYNTSTWNTRTLGRCDEARLQLMYDVKSQGGPYADCFDNITNAGNDGLVTDLTAAPSSTTVCANTTVTIAGRLQVHDYASYGPLGANGVAARTVWIDRGSTLKYTSTTTSTSSGNNWSRSFTGSNVTFDYVAHYDRPTSEGLDSSPDRAFSITWLSPQVPC